MKIDNFRKLNNYFDTPLRASILLLGRERCETVYSRRLDSPHS